MFCSYMPVTFILYIYTVCLYSIFTLLFVHRMPVLLILYIHSDTVCFVYYLFTVFSDTVFHLITLYICAFVICSQSNVWKCLMRMMTPRCATSNSRRLIPSAMEIVPVMEAQMANLLTWASHSMAVLVLLGLQPGNNISLVLVVEVYSYPLTLTVLNFWKFTNYCSLKPLWSGMGEVLPARTSPILHPPSPPTVHQLSRLAL